MYSFILTPVWKLELIVHINRGVDNWYKEVATEFRGGPNAMYIHPSTCDTAEEFESQTSQVYAYKEFLESLWAKIWARDPEVPRLIHQITSAEPKFCAGLRVDRIEAQFSAQDEQNLQDILHLL